MTITATTTVTRSWSGLHCFAYWPPNDLDTFLTGTVTPLLDRARVDGDIADWFYIRYWEGGPHLRIRLRDPAPGVTTRVGEELTALMAAAPHQPVTIDGDRFYARLGGLAATSTAGWHDHGDVREYPYTAETGRYGGPAAMPVAEDVFCRSSEIATRVVAGTGEPRARLAVAAELAIATALALGLDRLAAGRWLRLHANNWRWQTEVSMLPPAAAQGQAARVLGGQAPVLRRRWDRVEALVAGVHPDSARSPVARWGAVVREARERLETPAERAGPCVGRWLWVWGSQLHMLFNRLGITPDEERSVCWLVASAALSPDGIAGFFDDGAYAPDRRYHESSKFLPGLRAEQGPRETGPDRPRNPIPYGRTMIPLPTDGPPLVPLAEVLRHRVTGRGRLGGPVSPTDLGTLMWSAHGITHRSQLVLPDGSDYEYAHRPYPSAGGRYVARLRLVVRDVPGLSAGVYHVDDVDRGVWRLGPAPSVTELTASSMWFGPDAPQIGGVDLTDVPALLGLYVELGELRERYGMRALRFAVAEAGHLAQAISMVGAAMNLAVGLIGGFYDDVAHELLGLDGTDKALVYLLPVGRHPSVGRHPGVLG